MAHLHLGVLDVAYSDASHQGEAATTTGEVAKKLEERYGVMETFYDTRKQKIADYLAQDMAHSLEDILKGKPIAASQTSAFTNRYHGINTEYSSSSLSYGADQRIEAEFRSFIFTDEMQKISIAQTGAPVSAAAASGRSSRKKAPTSKKNKARPAFVDTGLYVASFRAWTQR